MSRESMIEKLTEDLANGRVVTIVGTGVSVAACGNQDVEGFKVATWTGLLQHGVKHCQDIGVADDKAAKLLNMQIESGDTDFLISAAETISKRIKEKGDGVFRGWLKDTIGKLKIVDRSILDAVALLPGVLTTLNYDSLLETATGRRAITWMEGDKTQEVLRREFNDGVLHLHGWWESPPSLVLGLSSYLSVKDDPHAKAVLDSLTLEHVLLFVGCGDTVLDPNFARLIDWGKEALKDVAPRHYLLCRTSEIADFQKKLADAPWLQPLDYGADYKDLVSFLRSLVPSDSVPPSPRPMSLPILDLTQYQHAMRKRYAHLKLDELDPTTHDLRTLTLTSMFIAQSARECAEFMPRVFELPKELQRRLRDAGEMEGGELDDDALAQHRRAYFDQSPRPILEIANDPTFRRLVVLGDPGSGKSTLLQYLLLQWAEKTVTGSAREPLPLLIELREYGRLRAEGSTIGFLEYLHRGESVRSHLDQPQLDAWLRANPGLLLFDGLDEIFDPTLRREISTSIHRFADEYPLARVVVTSRIIGYKYEAWRDEGFRHFMLEELDEKQIEDFLGRWHRGAYEESAKGEAKRTLLVHAIENSPAIRELAGNPLLLTMMAILNRAQDLARDRSELYEQCARLLLHQWKVDVAFSFYKELANASLDFKDKRNLLLRVASAMESSAQGLAGNLIDESTLERVLEEGLKGVPNLRPDRGARALIEQLQGRNFMLCSVGGRSYAFVHRTFLEYFCACHWVERREDGEAFSFGELISLVEEKWQSEEWHEVLRLIVSCLKPLASEKVIHKLLELDDPERRGRNLFLAANCFMDLRNAENFGLLERLLDRLVALAEQPFPNDPDWVVEVRRASVRAFSKIAPVNAKTRRQLQKWMTEDGHPRGVPETAVEALAQLWKGDVGIYEQIKRLAENGRIDSAAGAAVHSAVRWFNQDPAATLLWLRNLCEGTWQLPSARRAALQELARGWGQEDDTRAILVVRATEKTEPEWLVRRAALQKLSQISTDRPETIDLLKHAAESDSHRWVREAALEVLSRIDDPSLLDWMKLQTQKARSAPALRHAVKFVVRYGKNRVETLAWLRGRVSSIDENWVLQRYALIELAEGWKKEEQIFEIVKECARKHPHGAVREAAVAELSRNWRTRSETLEILDECARGDSDEWARAAARKELARVRKEARNLDNS